MSFLELNNVSFEYLQGGNSTFRLNNISLSIKKGEYVTLVGPNGSGKSTLLKIISRLLKPDSGEIKLQGKNLFSYNSKEIAKIIAVVPQSFSSVFPYTIYETVMMGRTPYLNMFGYESDADRNIVEEALEKVEISHLKEKGLNEVSGGEAQRAFIARALVQQPKILLLDEPNAHLDINHQISVSEIIKSLNLDNEMTVFGISHDLNLAGIYTDRLIMMKNGQIVLDGNKSEVLNSESILEVFNTNDVFEKTGLHNQLTVKILPND